MDRLLSIIIPIYNEVATLPELRRRLHDALAPLSLPYEILFVDDCSRDGSAEALAAFAKGDDRIRVVTLTRNFGHQAALSAGLDFASGDAVVMMDGDLQDPPEVVPRLVDEWLAGAEIVLTVKAQRREAGTMRLGAWLFYRLIRLLGNVDVPRGAGIFSLMDRRVVEALHHLPERARYLVGLRSWVGFRQATVPYERPARLDGESRVGLLRLIRLALDGIFSFSVIPLRLITLLGFGCFVGSLVVSAGLVALRLFEPQLVLYGWTSTVLIGLFIGGIQLLVLGIIGEYLGRVLEEVKARPLYIVRDVTGKSSHPGAPHA